MATKRKVPVKYYTRYYKTFANVPTEVLPELRGLTLEAHGGGGIMHGLIPCPGHKWKTYQGYYHNHTTCTECGSSKDAYDLRYQKKLWSKIRHIVVAFDMKTDKAIGWAVTDDEAYINIFVNPKMRGQGIATKLAVRYLGKAKRKSIPVHNEKAWICVMTAVVRTKRKVKVDYCGW